MYAALYGHEPILQTLINAGVDLNLHSENDMRETALILASGSFFATNRVKVVKMLVAAGAEIEARDESGRTALVAAILAGTGGYPEVLKALIELGANINVCDAGGNSVLKLAQNLGRETVASIFTEAGASENGEHSSSFSQCQPTE